MRKHKTYVDDEPAPLPELEALSEYSEYRRGAVRDVKLVSRYRSSVAARSRFQIVAGPNETDDEEDGVSRSYEVLRATEVRSGPSVRSRQVGVKQRHERVRGRRVSLASSAECWLALEGGAVGFVLVRGPQHESALKALSEEEAAAELCERAACDPLSPEEEDTEARAPASAAAAAAARDPLGKYVWRRVLCYLCSPSEQFAAAACSSVLRSASLADCVWAACAWRLGHRAQRGAREAAVAAACYRSETARGLCLCGGGSGEELAVSLEAGGGRAASFALDADGALRVARLRRHEEAQRRLCSRKARSFQNSADSYLPARLSNTLSPQLS